MKFNPSLRCIEIFIKKSTLAEYYRLKREHNLIIGKSQNMRWRRFIHPLIIKFLNLDRKILNKQTVKVLSDKHKESNKPVIYAITHVGYYDYQVISEVLQKHQIPFAGDPEQMYRTMDGFLMWLNGVVYCDTENKSDRKVAYKTAIEYIKQGNDMTIYPEGVWNVSPNLLMLPLFPGAIKMAMETGVDIIPVAIEQYDKKFVINIGNNYEIDRVENNTLIDNKDFIESHKNILRDIMATLKWEIFESEGVKKREEINNYQNEENSFVKTRLDEWIDKKTGKRIYNKQIIKRRTYKERNED